MIMMIVICDQNDNNDPPVGRWWSPFLWSYNIVGQSREPNDPPIAALCVADLLLTMSHKARRRPNQQSYDDSDGIDIDHLLNLDAVLPKLSDTYTIIVLEVL